MPGALTGQQGVRSLGTGVIVLVLRIEPGSSRRELSPYTVLFFDLIQSDDLIMLLLLLLFRCTNILIQPAETFVVVYVYIKV